MNNSTDLLAQPAAMAPASSPAATQTLERSLHDLLATVSAQGVFGRPVEKGEVTVIPCAEVFAGMGLGGGRGTSAPSQQQTAGEGEGVGGGGGGRARPIAVIAVAPDGVTVRPVLDVTRIALAGVATGAFMTYWLIQLAAGTRASRSRKAPSPPRLARMLRD